jgi:hypothetical protein
MEKYGSGSYSIRRVNNWPGMNLRVQGVQYRVMQTGEFQQGNSARLTSYSPASVMQNHANLYISF